jgi:serine/threonine protein phosphatase PrpC
LQLAALHLARDIHSGATATVVVVNGRNVTAAAVGDSLVYLSPVIYPTTR